MLFPKLIAPEQTQDMTSAFYGYNHTNRLDTGEFYDMQNLTSEYFPLLSPRHKRSDYLVTGELQGILAKDALAWVKDNTLYYNGLSMSQYMTAVSITSGQKTMLSMGAYLCIFPDGIYFNTEDYSDNGYMAHSNSVNAATYNVTLSICKQDGTGINAITSATAPTNPNNGDYWLDTSQETHTLKQWSATTSQWVSVPTVYVKIAANGIGQGFSKYDGIQLSGLTGTGQVTALNGSHILYAVDASYIVVIGILDASATQTSGTVKAERVLPGMDYITESGNRLWGCKYGVSGGKTVNEIYCCKLGDFKNWESYMGISTDSWRASVGTDGAWTGAATIADSPVFFKEDCMHRVYPSSTGAHQIVEQKCSGIQRGSAKSAVVIGGRLYYKSRMGVCVYDGSLPSDIGSAFGTDLYHDAVGGGVRDRYYLSMLDASNAAHLFVYDTKRGLWHREDDLRASAFAAVEDELYCLTGSGAATALKALYASSGTEEASVSWRADTGVMTYVKTSSKTVGAVGKKYISRINIRMQLPKGSRCDFYVQYDSDGIWHPCGHMEGRGLRSFTLPIRPARCDHFRFRLTGTGDCKIYSISKILEAGSDV